MELAYTPHGTVGMVTKTKVLFAKKRVAKQMLDYVVRLQTKRLVEYAKNELTEMVVRKDFESQTFNLIDSYVWAVFYHKKEQSHGFLSGKMAKEKSYLHAWSKTNRIPVDGRQEAYKLIEQIKAEIAIEDGWTIVWGAVAPYAIYLDPAAGSTRTNHFFVISQRYDSIKAELEPKCKVEFTTSI